MFCSNCGAPAQGNFCARCGAPLSGGTVSAVAQAPNAAPVDWSQEVRYETLRHLPEVRDRLARHAAMAGKGMSAEEFLALADKVLPVSLGPLTFGTLGSAVAPLATRMGISTGKDLSTVLARPPGQVIVAAMCSLARRGQALRGYQQYDDGCMLEATLPSDMFSWEGTLVVGIRRQGDGSLVEAATRIQGQKFDWGKSKRVLEALLEDLKLSPA
jgi:hypothetical protein